MPVCRSSKHETASMTQREVIGMGITPSETWEAMTDLGWFLPAKTSSIAKRQQWLLAVRDGRVCCPRQDIVRYRICRARPLPTKKYLMSEYKRLVLASRNNNDQPVNFGFVLGKYEPDINWLISCIATLDYDHDIFKPGWTRLKEKAVA